MLQTNAHKCYTYNTAPTANVHGCLWCMNILLHKLYKSRQADAYRHNTPTQSLSIDWPALLFKSPQANWSFLTQTNTHNLILCDTSPLGHHEDVAILKQTSIYKLDITKRWQPGSAMYTWINKHEHKDTILENIPLGVSAHVKVTEYCRERLSVNIDPKIMIPSEWFIIILMLITWCVQQQAMDNLSND